MRNPKRIHRMMKELEELWKVVPNWRFGQLICNIFGTQNIDIFHIEDDKAEEIIKNYLNELKTSNK